MSNLFYIIQLLLGISWIYILFNSFKIFSSKKYAYQYKKVTGEYLHKSDKFDKKLVNFEESISSVSFFWTIIGLLSSNYQFYILILINLGLIKLIIYLCDKINKYTFISYLFMIIYILINIIIIFTILFNKYHSNNNLNIWSH